MLATRLDRLRWACVSALWLLCTLSLGVPMAWSAPIDSIPRRKLSATEILSLRFQTPPLRYSRSAPGGIFTTSRSALVFVDGDQTAGSISLPKPLLPPLSSMTTRRAEVKAKPVEMRILGRRVYFDREVPLFTVTDLTGRQVITLRKVREASLLDLRPGIYLLRCEWAGTPTVTKVVLK